MPEVDLSRKEYERIMKMREQARIGEQKEKEKKNLIRTNLSEEEYQTIMKTRERMQNLRQRKINDNSDDVSRYSHSKLVEIVRALNVNSTKVVTIDPNERPYTACSQCGRPIYASGDPHAITCHPENFSRENLIDYLRAKGVRKFQTRNVAPSKSTEMAYAIKEDLSIVETSKETAMSLCKKGKALMWTSGVSREYAESLLKDRAKGILRDEKYASASRFGKLWIVLGEFADEFMKPENHSDFRGTSESSFNIYDTRHGEYFRESHWTRHRLNDWAREHGWTSYLEYLDDE